MTTLDQVKDCLNQGRLSEAVEITKTCVREDPSDLAARATLVSLFALQGDFDRALQQFKTQKSMGGLALPPIYESLLSANSQRTAVLSGQAAPHFLEEAPSWAASYQSALSALSQNQSEDELLACLESLNADLDQISGQNGTFEFEGLRNCDSRLAPVFEGIFDGQYCWIPFSSILRISVPARPDLIQDLVWCPVILMLGDNAVRTGHLFSTYPGTAQSGSPNAVLARTVEWDESFESVDVGLGQQMFYLGEEPVPLFSLGQCSINAKNPTATSPETEDETA